MSTHEKGFSAAELLITLFIGSVFLLAGYQLWIYVIKAGANSDQLAKASNVAYDYLRRYSNGQTCPSTPVNNQPLTNSDLSNATVTVTVSCPYTASGTPTSVKRIKSTVKYGPGSEPQEVSHVTLAN